MQKIGYNPKNEGWLYVHLPQSMYLTSPKSERYYFGYSDPRFKYFTQNSHSFQEICTYSFLGFGEFNKTADGLWSNNNFSVPSAILDMLLEATTEVRVEQFMVWRNLFRRDPELVRQVGALKLIYPYTRDGMYLYGQSISEEFRNRLMDLQGIVYFQAGAEAKLSFEESLEKFKLPDTKVFRKLLLDQVTRSFHYTESPFTWAALCFRLYGLDNTQTMLRECPQFFRTQAGNFPLDSEAFQFLVKFLSGVEFKQFRKQIVEDINVFSSSLFGQSSENNRRWFENNFSLDRDNKERPYFWDFAAKHKIKLPDAIALLGANCSIEEMLRPITSGIEILYRDKDLLFRSPRTGMELYAWGKRLSNCLFQKLNQITGRGRRNFIFGIFEQEALIGAVQLSPAFRTVEIQVSKKFDPDKEKAMKEIVLQQIKKLNPSIEMRKVLRYDLEDVLMGKYAMAVSPLTDGDKIAKAEKIITDYVKELFGNNVIDEAQQKALNKMAPQMVRRSIDELGARAPDSLRALLNDSKYRRARHESPLESRSQPLLY